MCEVLLRVRDKINSVDVYADVQCLKRGDIVSIVPDGWNWGSAELTNDDWRIVKLPNIALSLAEAFLAPELPVDPQNPGKMLRRRGFKFDIDDPAIPVSFAAWLADNTRVQPTRTVNFTGPQLLAFKKAKTPLADPNVIV